MNNMKNYIVSAVVAVVVVVAGFSFFVPKAPVAGSVTGPDVSFHAFYHDNMTIGGFDFATSSVGAVTYTAASIVNSRVIEHQAASAVTATLPTNAALSALGFLPNVGDTQTLFIHASTTAVVLVGNTGVTLTSASTTKQVLAGSFARLEFIRLGATEGRLILVKLTTD